MIFRKDFQYIFPSQIKRFLRSILRQHFLNLYNMESTNQSPNTNALQFSIIAECPVTKARTSLMKLPHYQVELPMFMPVGTQGTMKGLTPNQVKEANAQIILGNTYHLGTRPGKDLFGAYDGLHEFMQWDRALLTDSGGFQMVSLSKLAEVTEEGVKFQSPFDGSACMLTPEESIQIQNAIGADIIMQLDDVVNVRETSYERFEVAVDRTTRWLDRCMKANKNPERQNLFPIVQGGVFPDLRTRSLEQLTQRDAPGYAIGGLSGGEEKNKFWPMVKLCTEGLPKNKPRYCMGVGFPVDIVICCALGVDMFDCVYPTRTARFGCALVDGGQINLKNKEYQFDFSPIDHTCDCSTCTEYSRAYIKTVITKETIGCHLISIHNIAFMMRLMSNIRESIKNGRFVQFVKEFMNNYYKGEYPQWVMDALGSVNISLEKGQNTQDESCDVDVDWNEHEEETQYLERVSGFQSSTFNKGYRQGVLNDYQDETERGRLLGYHTAIATSFLPHTTTAIEPPVPQAHTPRCDSWNPTTIVSKWMGILLACQAMKQGLTDAENVRIKDLISRIEQLLSKTYTPNDQAVKVLCNAAEEDVTLRREGNLQCVQLGTQEALRYIEESKQLCSELNWSFDL